jgi:adenylylsulfate kinase-like enzyme
MANMLDDEHSPSKDAVLTDSATSLRSWAEVRRVVDERPEARLVLLCGLPGSGKTTLAKRLEHEIPAVRLCPDEWMADLGIDLFDERTRDRLETRFWDHARELLRLGQTVILEFGFWPALSAMRSASRRAHSAFPSNCTISL